MKRDIDTFINSQLSLWHLARDNFRALKNAETKCLEVGGLEVRLQHNPARIISSAARTDEESVRSRKCFLCRDNRPQEQIKLRFDGRKGKRYDILVNPYPILHDHIVIAMDQHVRQSIWRRFVDMLDLAKCYQSFTFFYNGPKCGASAPDHHHFQAVRKGQLPLLDDVNAVIDSSSDVLEYVTSVQDADLYHYHRYTRGIFVVRAKTAKSAAKMFYRLIDCAPVAENDREPMFNLFTEYVSGEYRTTVVFRARHRPHQFFSSGEDHLMISPGCIDMAGVFVAPVKKDYERIDGPLLQEIIGEVSISGDDEKGMVWRLTRTQEQLCVGIMSAKEIEFEILSDGAGMRKARYTEGKIEYDGALYDELFFEAQTLSTMFAEPSFVLAGVTIGVDFHWERKETQKFAGALKIIVGRDCLTAVNVIGVEDYIVSVISSEMKSTSSLELLKAHSVISRSWVISQIRRRGHKVKSVHPEGISDVPAIVSYVDSLKHSGSCISAEDDGICEYVRWYDKEDHKDFDVCADDHCQRYQGLTRASGEAVRKAVDQTWGEVLTCGGGICDARFSKCCGGMMEEFSTCWEDRDFSYLKGIPDSRTGSVRNLKDEAEVRDWIESAPEESFCNVSDTSVLSQVLNSYDLETMDFFRWETGYSRKEISEIIRKRTGHDIGELVAIVPVARGTSGRLYKVEIIGTGKTLKIGKELEIRRSLSLSHLKSSAFVVDYYDENGMRIPEDIYLKLCREGKPVSFDRIVIRGAGWGHGVGLCQIGAASMAEQGYGYRDILSHYYPKTEIGNGEDQK